MENLFAKIDRIAGGSKAGLFVDAAGLAHPKTKRTFAWITGLLVVELILGFGAVVAAVIIAEAGGPVPFAVWMRTVVVRGMTATLFYFFWRSTKSFWWGYQRLRLFAQIFPVITLVMAAIPGLYPIWMITEQVVFGLIMIGVGDFLTTCARCTGSRWAEPHPATSLRASCRWAAMSVSLSSGAPSAPVASASITRRRPAIITRSAFSAPQRTSAGIGSREPEKTRPSRRNIARSACLPTSMTPMSSRPSAADPRVAQSRARSHITASEP